MKSRYEYNKAWRHNNIDKRNAERKNYYTRNNYAPRDNDGKIIFRHWSDKESELVLAHSIPDRELAKKLKRSVQAIQAQRHRLKKRKWVKKMKNIDDLKTLAYSACCNIVKQNIKNLQESTPITSKSPYMAFIHPDVLIKYNKYTQKFEATTTHNKDNLKDFLKQLNKVMQDLNALDSSLKVMFNPSKLLQEAFTNISEHDHELSPYVWLEAVLGGYYIFNFDEKFVNNKLRKIINTADKIKFDKVNDPDNVYSFISKFKIEKDGLEFAIDFITTFDDGFCTQASSHITVLNNAIYANTLDTSQINNTIADLSKQLNIYKSLAKMFN